MVERDNGNIWVLSTRFQKFFLKQVDVRQINIRILRIRPEQFARQPSMYHGQNDHPPIYYNNTLGL